MRMRISIKKPSGLTLIQRSLRLALRITDTLDEKITFSRASTATYYNSSGNLVLAGIDTPRIEYSPTTLQREGLLIENSSTNYLLNSLLDGSVLSTQSLEVLNQPYTFSCSGNGTVVISGAYSTSITGSSPTSRTHITFTPTADTLNIFVTGNIYWAQLEVGEEPTSFIPTEGSPVTRAADIAYVHGTSFTSWYTTSEGTILIESKRKFSGTAGSANVSLSDGSLTNEMRVLSNNKEVFLGFTPTAAVNNDGVFSSVTGTIGSSQIGTVSKLALSYSAAAIIFGYNGSSSIVSGTPPTSITRLYLGARGDGSNQFNGYIKSFNFYSSALEEEMVHAITTL